VDVQRHRIARRDLLRATALAAGAAALLPGTAWAGTPGTRAASTGSTTTDYRTRAAFDQLDLGFNDGNGRKNDLNEDSGALGWGESYVLQAYLLMYETHRDPYYLHKAIDHIDHVLANRDSERGVTDWRGLSLPGWRLAHPYSCGELYLKDAEGREVLRLRSARAYSRLIEITVSEGSTPGTFRIYAKHPLPSFNTPDDPCEEVHDNLSMDPDSPDYVVTRLWNEFSVNDVQLTAKDLRPHPSAGGNPVPVQATMTDPKFHSSVHTGQITYPIAKFARLVRTTPELWISNYYRAKALEYRRAALEAVHIHDDEWRENEHGEAWYAYNKGAPVNLDGSDLPHNYSASMARTWLELAMFGDDPESYQRATKLVRMFHNDIRRLADGTASWTYYWTKGLCYRGWSREDGVSENMPTIGAGTRGEDISHGHIEVTMAVTAHRARVLFSPSDLQMLARTLTSKVLVTQDGTLGTSTWVDGSGFTTGYRQIVAGWLGLAPFDVDGSMVQRVHDTFAASNPVPETVPIYASAWLNWAARFSR